MTIWRRVTSKLSSLLVALALTITMTQSGCSSATASGPGPDAAAIADPQIEIPKPPIPTEENLPAPCRYGKTCPRGIPELGDVIFAPVTYWAVRDYLDDWAEYPETCGVAIESCHQSWRSELVEAAKVYAAQLAEEDTGDDRWLAWEAYLAIAIATVASAAVGAVVGFVAGL